MRLSKGLLVLALFMVAVSPGIVKAQTVSLEDSLWIVPAELNVGNNKDTNFNITIMIKNAKSLGAIAIPLVYPGLAELRIDTTIFDLPGEFGVTYGPAGNDAGWTIRTSFIVDGVKGILIGFVNFFGALAPTSDTLVYVHFDLDAQVGTAVINLDSGVVNAQHLSITTDAADEFIPTWNHLNAKINVGPVAIGDEPGIMPNAYALNQNFPNPFNADTRISFALPKADQVRLRVFNVLGQEVVTLVDGLLDANQHDIIWDGTNAQGTVVASGTYFYRLEIGDVYEKTLRMTLLK